MQFCHTIHLKVQEEEYRSGMNTLFPFVSHISVVATDIIVFVVVFAKNQYEVTTDLIIREKHSLTAKYRINNCNQLLC